jgi:negative regulator of flagellin synthesis FlgM
MKIGQTSDNLTPVNTAAQAASQKSDKSSQSASTASNVAASKSTQSAGVAVTVSTLARSMGAAKADQVADIDMEKVNSVRNAIQNGTYKVNAEAIADKLLSNALDMLNTQRN